MAVLDAVSIEEVTAAIRQGWGADTSSCAEWSPDCPSRGQCAVSALVVQDYFGGVLLRCTVSGVSHYWTRLPDGKEIDLTFDQFAPFAPDADAVERTRPYVLGFADTARRYRLLTDRVRRSLGRV